MNFVMTAEVVIAHMECVSTVEAVGFYLQYSEAVEGFDFNNNDLEFKFKK